MIPRHCIATWLKGKDCVKKRYMPHPTAKLYARRYKVFVYMASNKNANIIYNVLKYYFI